MQILPEMTLLSICGDRYDVYEFWGHFCGSVSVDEKADIASVAKLSNRGDTMMAQALVFFKR